MKKIVNTTNAPAPIGPYNQAVIVGDSVYISGTIAMDLQSKQLVKAHIKDETKLVMEYIEAILKEAQSKGVKETLAKYELYPATYYYWKRKYELYGENGLGHQKTKNSDKRTKLLEEENARLKMLLADKELQIKYPDISLKKLGREWKKLK